jgi:hypothetical protein
VFAAIYDILPIIINGNLFTKAAVSSRVIEHNGAETEEIVKYYVSTLNGKKLVPKITDHRGEDFVRTSNCLLGTVVPGQTQFRDSRFRLLPKEKIIYIYHLCPINARYCKQHYPEGPTIDEL